MTPSSPKRFIKPTSRFVTSHFPLAPGIEVPGNNLRLSTYFPQACVKVRTSKTNYVNVTDRHFLALPLALAVMDTWRAQLSARLANGLRH